jgi:hypothetical protein
LGPKKNHKLGGARAAVLLGVLVDRLEDLGRAVKHNPGVTVLSGLAPWFLLGHAWHGNALRVTAQQRFYAAWQRIVKQGNILCRN